MGVAREGRMSGNVNAGSFDVTYNHNIFIKQGREHETDTVFIVGFVANGGYFVHP